MLKTRAKLSNQTKLLISDQIIRKICEIFFELFLSAYMYKISETNGILCISLYQTIRWITSCICVFGVSRIINRHNKIWIYRLGITIKLSIILLVALLGPKIVPIFWLIAILDGIMVSSNGYLINYFESENIPKNEIIRYIGLGNAFSSLTNMLVPVALGSSIFINSFETTAFVLTIIVAIELLICFNIKGKTQEHPRRKLDYRGFLKLAIRDPNYRSLCLQQTLAGINRKGVMSLLISILIFQSVGNELSLGGWTSISSLFGVIAMLTLSRFYKNRYRAITQITAGVSVIIGCLPLFFEVNFVNIIIFNIIFYTFVRSMERIVHIDLINYSKTERYRTKYLIEFFSIREIFLTIGRVLGFVALGTVTFLDLGTNGFKAVLVLIMLSIVFMALTSAHYGTIKKRIK